MTVSIAQLLRFMLEQGASDLHVSAGERPAMRVQGDMRWVDTPPLTADEAHHLVFDVMSDAHRRTFQEKLECDFAFRLDDATRFRVNAFVHDRGEAAVFRAIPTRVPKMKELGLPEVVRGFCREEKGLVLVTGPTGSGKSTTLAAMIDHLNETMSGHILTLEDPIEFVHVSKRALVNQRQVGAQTHSFQSALKSALREDPDVILVGELRDMETISLALTAAETGHLVFGTLHTSSAPKTVDRVLDVFPSAQQPQIRAMFSESIVGIVSQMLVKTTTGKRTAALEILVGTPGVRNLIREGKTHQIPSMMQVGAKAGMQTTEAALADLVSRGIVSVAEARARMPSSELLQMIERGSAEGRPVVR
jgi:twitching motility protein PilT